MAFTKLDRENLQNFLQLKANNYWAEYKKLPGFSKIGKCPIIILNGRIFATAGYNSPLDNTVDLSLKLYRASIENQITINNVILPHELAHQIDCTLNGLPKNNRWHGPTWCDIMVRIGQPPDIYHTMGLKK